MNAVVQFQPAVENYGSRRERKSEWQRNQQIADQIGLSAASVWKVVNGESK